MKLTAIKKSNRGQLFNIFIDNELIGQLSLGDINDLNIHIGQSIDQKLLETISKQVDYNKFYLKALKYADIRLRTSYELKQFLKAKGCHEPTVNKILSKLEELNIINEQQYIKAFIHDSQLLKPMSKNLIIAKLRSKHISQATIDLALSQLKLNDANALDDLINKKLKSSTYANNHLKLFNYLLRQGFSYQEIVDKLGLPSKLSGSRGSSWAVRQ